METEKLYANKEPLVFFVNGKKVSHFICLMEEHQSSITMKYITVLLINCIHDVDRMVSCI